MSTQAQPRPPQVTLAGWMIILGSVMVVGSVFEVIGGLRSLETREAVESFLSEAPGDTLGWSVETVLQFLRIASMVTAGCATAAAVLGWHALRRNRSARIGLTVLAVPLFLTGIVTGGFMSSLVAAASLLLWLQPARDWFNGKAWVPPNRDAKRSGDARPPWPPVGPTAVPPRDPGSVAPPQAHGVVWPTPGAEADQGPRPVQGFGSLPATGAEQTTSGQPQRRPDVVLVAALTTWIFAGFTFLSSALSLLVVALDPAMLTEELERQQPDLAAQGVSEEMLLTTTVVMGVLVVLWSLAAVVAAILVMRRVPWAGTLLLVLAVGAALACALASTVMLAMALPALAAVVVIVMLRRPDVRAWLASASG